jgi:DNA mismatch repair protein MutS
MRASQDSGPQGQLSFTMSPAPQEPDALRELLQDVDPDTLTPRDALALIYKLKSS